MIMMFVILGGWVWGGGGGGGGGGDFLKMTRPVVDVWERGSLTFEGDWPTTSYFILTLRYE